MLRNLDLDRLRNAQDWIDKYLETHSGRAEAVSRGVDAFAGSLVINGLAQALVMAGSKTSGDQAGEMRFAATMVAAWLLQWRPDDLPQTALGSRTELANLVKEPLAADNPQIVAKGVAALLSIADPILYCALSEEAAAYLRQVKIFAKARKAR